MSTDATQITGSPLAEEVARRGDVLAERYELLEAVDTEGPSVGYRALDQETERSVLVRVLAGPVLRESALGEVLERLRGLVGVGGRYVSSLLDADREGRRPFTVEAWPSGTQLSAIFEARRQREGSLGASEVLPVIARISAGLSALPPPWHHGDVRAERVWVDTDGVRLTGAFLLAALPPPVLEEHVAALGPGALAYAPEVASGRSSASADRWGLAAIAWEALTGRRPDVSSEPPELSGPLLIALRRLLDAQPGRRPKDLRALIDALARQAGLPVPRIDAEPHQRPAPASDRPPAKIVRRIEGAAEEGTQEVSFDQIMEERALSARRRGRRVEGGAEDGTQEIELDSEDAIDPDLARAALASADVTAKHAPSSGEENSEGGLDPRLVRAALGIMLEDEPSSEDALDPRLVRAALGIAPDASDEPIRQAADGVDELPSDELEIVGEPTAPAAKPAIAPPAEEARAPERALPAPRPRPLPPKPASAQAPTQPKPASPPAPQPGPPPRPSPIPPARSAQPQSTPVGMRPASGEGGSTAIVPRPEEPPRPPKKRRRSPLAGPLIVVSALLLGVVIVALGFLVRSWMTREQDSRERERHIQERLEQIRNAEQ